MLVGDGALQFALSQGFQKKIYSLKNLKEWKEWLKTSQYKPIGLILKITIQLE
jgi:N4-(beta-N-acetylglucosaminyl)-L-asparaginase